MPRTRRVLPPNAVLHIVSRGNNRQPVFYSDTDKLRYYSLAHKFKEENSISILHYCFMDNHVHIIVSLTPRSTLSKFMKQLNLTYFHYYRKRYVYCGHFWQDRFKSNVIETDSYLLQCGKYIELNPVRAGMVSKPEQYAFSSYSFYAKGKPDSIITPSPAYLGLSDSDTARQKQYVVFVIDSDIINKNILEKRAYIGSPFFIAGLQKYYGINNKRDQRGRPPKHEN